MRWGMVWALVVLLCACDDEPAGDAGSGANGSGAIGGQGHGGTGAASSAGGAAGSGGMGGGGAEVHGFPASWPDGTGCGSEDPIFVWRYADDTYILRQSLCTSFEAPFLFLLFGEERVLLEDTGDGGIPVQPVVQGIIDTWLSERGQSSVELVVAHSHAHGDHVAGDGQFQGQPSTTVVGTGVSAVESFFGIASWPDQTVAYDLGGRVIDVIPIPGHQAAHVAFYDRRHRLLLTGDTLYPGRLYISDFPVYQASTQRLVDFVAMGNSPSWVLGTHIEMTTTAGDDFAFGATQHPNEHVLELGPEHLTELNASVQAMGSSPVMQTHDDFIIYPL